MAKAKKQAPKGTTLVNFILDQSGSMSSIKTATISGFNEYIETLKKDTKSNYDFSLTLFDTNIEKRFVKRPLKELEGLNDNTFTPNGMTALYDAVCQTIDAVKREANSKDKILTVIMTDGGENSSKEFTEKDLKSRITELEKLGNWTFVFLGANQDSYLNAQKYGIAEGNTANFVASSVGVAHVMRTMATNTSNFSAMAYSNTSAFFSGADQKNLENSGNISEHFSKLGKKSWESRKKNLLDKDNK